MQYAVRSAPSVVLPAATTAFRPHYRLGVRSAPGPYDYTYSTFTIVAGASLGRWGPNQPGSGGRSPRPPYPARFPAWLRLRGRDDSLHSIIREAHPDHVRSVTGAIRTLLVFVTQPVPGLWRASRAEHSPGFPARLRRTLRGCVIAMILVYFIRETGWAACVT